MLDRVTANPESFMLRPPTMIQGNPYQKGFDAQEQRTAQADQRAAAELERDQKTAFSQGLAGIIADPANTDPAKRASAVAGLASRTGQSQLALTTLGNEETRRKQAEDKTLDAAASGNVALARHYAQQNGITIPDAILNDGQIAKGLKAARDMGYEDPQQAATFAAEFKRTGDPVAASTSAGPPKAKPITPSYQVFNQVGPDGKIIPYRFDQRAGTAEPIAGIDGGFQRPGSGAGAGGGRQLNFEAKRQAYLQVYPGDQKGALAFANGQKAMSIQDARKAAQVTVRSLKNEYGEPLFKTEQEVLDATERFAQNLIGGGSAPPASSNLSTVTPPPGGGGNSTVSAPPADLYGGMSTEQLEQWLRDNGGAP